MGGNKCSYKNCAVRSDGGKTHLFHYPVLNRTRCHKWLMQAQRHNFLNLKVSQLKNRVICQNHFTLDDFMNETMTKLKPNAIPSVDGPYCDLKTLPQVDQNAENFNSVALEDIENLTYPRKYLETTTILKKKYSNFLVDSEMLDEGIFVDDTKSDNKADPDEPFFIVPLLNSKGEKSWEAAKKFVSKEKLDRSKRIPRIQNQRSKNSSQVSMYRAKTKKQETEIETKPRQNISIGNNPVRLIKSPTKKKLNTQITNIEEISPINKPFRVPQEATTDKSDNTAVTPKNSVKATKIQILSEEQILEPVPFAGPFKPVEPKSILSIPRTKTKAQNNNNLISMKSSVSEPEIINKQIVNFNSSDLPRYTFSIDDKLNITVQDNSQMLDPQQNSFQILQSQKAKIEPVKEIDSSNNVSLINSGHSVLKNVEQHPGPTALQSLETSSIQKKSKLRSGNTLNLFKINPERQSAIEQKRQFNKKLRDMISFQMDFSTVQPSNSSVVVEDITNSQEVTRKVLQDDIKESVANKSETLNNSVMAHLSKDASVQQAITLAVVEERIKKMEELFLNRIDHNTQTITSLKNSIETQKLTRAAITQTDISGEVHKKQLYLEISKYLSPETCSLVYEELFIDKHVSSIPKRRKLR